MRKIAKNTMLIFFLINISICYADNPIAQQQLILHSQSSFNDLPQLLKKRNIKVLVVNSPAYYFIAQSRPQGMAYELMREYEHQINRRYFNNTKLKLNILFIPVASSQIINMLEQGYGDIAIGPLVATGQSQHRVTFTEPTYSDIQLVLASNKKIAELTDISQLSEKEIWIRKDSIYHEKLQDINQLILAQGKPPIYINLVDDSIEDYELLNMLDNQKISLTVVSSHALYLWEKLYKNIKLNTNIQLSEQLSTTWAVRNNTPQLAQSLNQFIHENKKGSTLGNILHRRYLVTHPLLDKIIYQEFETQYLETIKLIKKYAGQYQFDWQLILAQAYQESRLNQQSISHKGAIGVMQVLPSTANEPYINIANIDDMDANIHAGIKYLYFIRKHYFTASDIQPLDALLFTFAAYNAGPTRLRALRQLTRDQGLDPNIWFNNVEQVTADNIGKETVNYVNNIYNFYLTYRLAAHYQLSTVQVKGTLSVKYSHGSKQQNEYLNIL
jgi:membrane-bound lytic murein transglycosylase MltF